jgi:hypothetical protein
MKSTLEELQAFISIVDSGSIVAAATHLEQTTSGVSRALQRLESKLNVTLLERTTRKLKLTFSLDSSRCKARLTPEVVCSRCVAAATIEPLSTILIKACNSSSVDFIAVSALLIVDF